MSRWGRASACELSADGLLECLRSLRTEQHGMSSTSVRVFFNFRSPYCYLVSRNLFARLAQFDIDLVWRSLGGWDGRSPPDRAKVKVPLTRQDVARWCKRMQIPFTPPPITTEPTPAALLSFAAEDAGLLAAYVEWVMWAEWAEGRDIGQTEVLLQVADAIGLSRTSATISFGNPFTSLAVSLRHALNERAGSLENLLVSGPGVGASAGSAYFSA